MERFTALLDGFIKEGQPVEEGLMRLRAQGATPIEAIKAIHLALGVNLAEAKQIFSQSPAWAREVAASANLHDEALAMLRQNSLQ